MQSIASINDNFYSLRLFLPELLLIFLGIGLLLLDLVFQKNPQKNTLLERSSWLGFLLLAYALWQQAQNAPNGYLFSQFIFLDNKAIYFKSLILLCTFVLVLHSNLLHYKWEAEWYILLPFLLLGLFVIGMASNSMSLYLGIELVSIVSYFFTAYPKQSKNYEAALKYLLYGGMVSAIFLYGASFLYGIRGTLDLIHANPNQMQLTPIAYIAYLFVLAGILFKLGAAPFHAWLPDVYETTPTPVVSFFSVAPKLAAFLALLRISFAMPEEILRSLLFVIVLTLTIGNFSALWQSNVKRLLAYSGIAQVGFMLIGLICQTELGLKSGVFYATAYALMSMGAFYMIDVFSKYGHSLNTWNGLGKNEMLMAFSFVVVLASLAGLPPTVGFTAKWAIFTSIWDKYNQEKNLWQVFLLVFAVLNTLVSLAYYLKIPYALFLKKESNQLLPNIKSTPFQQAFALLFVFLLIFFFLFPNTLFGLIDRL